MITCKNITYRYPDNNSFTLQNVNITIQKGESIAVMGANGSGKSTFANIVASLINPDRGTISIDSKNHLPVGIIFQNPDNQFVAMTVEKEIAFTMENLAYPHEKIDGLLKEYLQKFNISHLRKKLISE